METDQQCVLSLNSGSSSIKFALYQCQKPLRLLVSGEMEGIGSEAANFHVNNPLTNEVDTKVLVAKSQQIAAAVIIEWLEEQALFNGLKAIGHRVVHGLQHTEPELVTPQLLDALRKISTYDPEHLPNEIQLIDLFAKRYPTVPQVACFDTSFHTSMPSVAKRLPIPNRFKGVQRYGFHGLSYAYIMQELVQIAGPQGANGKVIVAHLGNGASLAAIKNGKSVDTSMGFTPASGITMSTRTGDLDPGVAWYLMDVEKLTPAQFGHLVNHESGLLAISETTSDMRELLKLEPTDNRAAEAIAFFCYHVKKCIGSFAAALAGVDTLVFSGGMGAQSPQVRARICDGLQFLGIEIDPAKNDSNDGVTSTATSSVTVRVIKTNEELMIARLVCDVMNLEHT